MIILASETISKRNNSPVQLEYAKTGKTPFFYWLIRHREGNGICSSDFEDVKEYIRKKKLLSPKQLEKIEGIKKSLLRSADYKLKELQYIEDIRNTPEYKKATELAEIAEQLMQDRKAQTIVQALKLLELASLREIKEELSSIDARLESIDIELSEE